MEIRKWKKQSLKVLSVALSVSTIATSAAFAGEWKRVDQNWKMVENG